MSDPTPTSTPTLAIDRLSIHVPAMSAEEAERLAEQVAESLRHWPHAPSAAGRIAHVDATVETSPEQQGATGNTGLAGEIATAVLEAALRELGQP
jgi:hypothetical protein